MKIGYVDCFSGISGDMFLGALLDAGLSIDHLRAELAKLNLADPYTIGFKSVKKGAITAGLFQVEIEGQEPPPSSAAADAPHSHSHPHPHEHAHPLVMTAHSHSHDKEESAGHQDNPEHGHEHGHEHAIATCAIYQR